MSSLASSTAASSFHLPQHAQFLHAAHTDATRTRRLAKTTMDGASSHGCAAPPPQTLSYVNPETNETQTVDVEVRVNEIGLLFDYEIRHANGVSWEDVEGSEGGGRTSSWTDKITGFFGRDNDDEEEEEEDAEGASLMELERVMASELWRGILADDGMLWSGSNDEEDECLGLVIQEDGRRRLKRPQRRRQDAGGIAPRKLEGGNEDGGEDVEYTDYDPYDNDGSMSYGEPVAEDVLEGANGDDAFTGTRLLGLTYQPLDFVNINGCTYPDKTCTSIRGQLSVAYAGTNEYGVIQSIVTRMQSGMEDGTFLSTDVPALNLEFLGSGGTFATTSGSGSGGIIQLNTARGTETNDEDAEDPLSKYGLAFVCLVGILGAGFIASMVVRYRKRKRRAKQANEDPIEMSQEEYEASFMAIQRHEEEEAAKTEGESGSMTDSPRQSPREGGNIINQVELGVPPVGSGADSNEVEISLSGSKSWS